MLVGGCIRTFDLILACMYFMLHICISITDFIISSIVLNASVARLPDGKVSTSKEHMQKNKIRK